MNATALMTVAASLFDEYGKGRPKSREAHVQAVLESILRDHLAHRERRGMDETVAHFEACVKKMHAVLGRPLFSSDWRAAHLYADLEA